MAIKQPQARRYWRVSEYSQQVGLAENTIRNAINAGELRAFRIGRSVRIPIDAALEFERRNTTGPAA